MALEWLHLSTLHKTPYSWPLRQLRIPQAHQITRGSAQVVVAVIDPGYTYHPHHEGHLWMNPNPARGDAHGWDCHDDDESLAYNLHDPQSPYHKGHHTFVVGEVIACAPECPVMIVRVGYGNPDSWWKGIEYAVGHGARVLVIPHGFITHGRGSLVPLFYRGTDFSYPLDNPRPRQALDVAYDAGCLVFKGTADNRGRRVATVMPGLDAVFAVGSSNRQGRAADICCSADYVEAAAPGGERSSGQDEDKVWSTGGNEDYIPFTGGCMAAGFAGGVGALVMSRYPEFSNDQLRQVLRNTAQGEEWNPKLGWGILDAGRAVSLPSEALCQRLKVSECSLDEGEGSPVLCVVVENRGAFDAKKALVVAFDGDPVEPGAPQGTLEKPVILATKQLGHAIGPVRGLHSTALFVELPRWPQGDLWVQVCTLDRHGSDEVDTVGYTRRCFCPIWSGTSS